jgi:hypothetical protein
VGYFEARIEYEMQKEELIDSLVADVVGGLAMFREPHCGGHVNITDEQLWDRARNVVSGLIGNYKIQALPKLKE